MRRVSARKPKSHAVGQSVEPVLWHRKIKGQSQSISSGLSARPVVVGAGLVLPYCNRQAMQWHLEEISSQVANGAHAIIILDQAGWHTTQNLEVPDNITLMPLPPRSPELNPVENLWQFMRDNWISNRIFSSYEEILAICCEAWNKLVEQRWIIMSIGLREWAHRF